MKAVKASKASKAVKASKASKASKAVKASKARAPQGGPLWAGRPPHLFDVVGEEGGYAGVETAGYDSALRVGLSTTQVPKEVRALLPPVGRHGGLQRRGPLVESTEVTQVLVHHGRPQCRIPGAQEPGNALHVISVAHGECVAIHLAQLRLEEDVLERVDGVAIPLGFAVSQAGTRRVVHRAVLHVAVEHLVATVGIRQDGEVVVGRQLMTKKL